MSDVRCPDCDIRPGVNQSGLRQPGHERTTIISEDIDYFGWTLAASEEVFRRAFPTEPRNWLSRDPSGTRQLYGSKTDEILAEVPERSNDRFLDALLRDLSEQLPADLQANGESVFAVRTPTLAVNAEAWIDLTPAGRVGHLIGVFEGVTTALYAYGIVARRCELLLLDEQENGLSVDALYQRVSTRFPELLDDPAVAYIRQTRRRWAAGDAADLDIRMADLINEFDDGRNPAPQVHELHRMFGERFIVAHELAHHLLGHTYEHNAWPKCSFPAAQLLLDRKARLGPDNPGEWTFRQQQELDADAFGFLLAAGWLASDVPNVELWSISALGAVVALPVLQDLARAPLADSRVRSVGLPDDYPPVGARLEQIIRLVNHVAQITDPTDPRHPVGAVLKGLLFGAFLEWW